MLELDFAIDRQGLVDPAHAVRYKEFGDWIRACYGAPVASTHPTPGATLVELSLPLGTAEVDRVMIQEDITQGQRIRAFVVEYLVGGQWVPFSRGESVGNKRIDVVGTPIAGARTFRLNVTQHIGAEGPLITNFAAFRPCSNGTVGGA